MQIFLDTANLEEIEKGVEWGIVDGVTTNPSLVSKESKDLSFHQRIKEICDLVKGPVSAETTKTVFAGMVKEARELANIDENVVVKIPMTPDGIKAVKVLSGENIKTNVTLVFDAMQALLAAKAGATYVSLFIGRLDDIASDGMERLAETREIFNNYGFSSKIIAASIRHPMHVLDTALMGIDVATIPFSILKKMFSHPLTDNGVEKFLTDWEEYLKG
ncbi:MAG: fructose-6-phosphate aldolase [Kosmotogaceae bacterium]